MEKTPLCTVIGAANIDIGGISDNPLVFSDSNPGRIIHSLGGVGRNIAHNLTLLGVSSRLVTALGKDAYGEQIKMDCEKLGMDLSLSCFSDSNPTSVYMFIDDKDGNMVLAVNDMNIYRNLTPEFIAERMDEINKSDIVVVDANIPEETISYIAKNCTCPIYADPVSTVKAARLMNSLEYIHTIKPNRIEAAALSGVTIDSKDSIIRAGKTLISKGLKEVFISLGDMGVFAINQREQYFFDGPKCNMVNETGAGDAMMAGLAFSALEGKSLAEKAFIAQSASAMALESNETINSEMCESALIERAILGINSFGI